MAIILREADLGRIDLKIAKILDSIVPEWEQRWRNDPILPGTYEPSMGLVAVS
jgi:hypothetical protein